VITFKVKSRALDIYLSQLGPFNSFISENEVDNEYSCYSIAEPEMEWWSNKLTSKKLSETRRKIKSAISKTDTKFKVNSELEEEIELLMFYIIGAIANQINDQSSLGFYDYNIAKYIRVHQILKDQTFKLKDLIIDIRPRNDTGVKFTNLDLLYPLHKNIVKAIEQSLMIEPESRLYKLVHDPSTTADDLEKEAKEYSKKLVNLERALKAKGALLLAKYLQEQCGFENKGSLISDDQIRIIYQLYLVMEWVEPRTSHGDGDEYIKVFRNFVRDHHKKLT